MSAKKSLNRVATLPPKERAIRRNRCQCSKCLTIIESTSVHDFVQCACGRIFTDGGHDYIHRGFKELSDIIDLTEFTEIDPLTKPRRCARIGGR